ncbi:putative zinc finger in N-recognin-domain-containing protein [Catenaria anguillulae PL171]|uniref:E3 ubiquitin-protein ligase n=1 Tax=Catenaria anguillulae PL171 TaxID=765915 RepID=A0A1Y2HMG7_9FUNG|nr:putative zinc finger in N-recognin-domain-containing protein [Catenaria anguillulae PL171]
MTQPMAIDSSTAGSSAYADMYSRVRALLDQPDAFLASGSHWSARDRSLLDPTSSTTDLALASTSTGTGTAPASAPTAAQSEGICPLETPKLFSPTVGAHLTAMVLSTMPNASSADVAAAATLLGASTHPDAPPLSPSSAAAAASKPPYLEPLFAALSAASSSTSCTSSTLTALARGHPPRPCGRVFKKADIVYRCATCAMDSTCVLCALCYEAQKLEHEGHDVYVHSSAGGGCCDCGDEEAWKRELHCSLHGTCNFGMQASGKVTKPGCFSSLGMEVAGDGASSSRGG